MKINFKIDHTGYLNWKWGRIQFKLLKEYLW